MGGVALYLRCLYCYDSVTVSMSMFISSSHIEVLLIHHHFTETPFSSFTILHFIRYIFQPPCYYWCT